MKKIKKIAIFFNSVRGYKVYNKLSKNYNINIFLSKKNLNLKILKSLKKKKANYKIIKNFEKKTQKLITKSNYDLFISAGFPLIFPKTLMNFPRYKTINLHAGKLPEYRGGSPLNWQIINEEKFIFINIIKMNEFLDEGDIYLTKFFSLKKNDTIKSVHKKVNNYFPIMTLNVINMLNKKIKPIQQIKKGVRYYKQRSDYDGLINWSKLDANQVYNFVRAITKPYPGAFYIKENKKTKNI
jgi:methionyl-tRNA formyltransferase